MTTDPKAGFTALNRFGFGARGDGDLAAAAADSRGFLESELRQPGIALLDGPDLRATPDLLKSLFDQQDQRRMEQQAFARAKLDAAAQTMADPAPGPAPQMALPPKPAKSPPGVQQVAYRAESLARFQRAATSRAGFVERLVGFWSNHFCVSAAKGEFVRVTAGAYEREAIRPHVLGRFADMLKAVEQHPAMIFYLDNQLSMGPDSPAGKNRKRGLNENLAREIMELHTLGVDGGYTQADVTSLARVITGWTFVGRQGRSGPPGSPLFFANYHEPGPQTVLGRNYGQTDRAQGLTALDDLARNPATARHIATKFARHFVADDPPPALVARLTRTFIDSDGDLKALALALLDSAEAWSFPPTKLRTPYEFLAAAARLTGRAPTDAGPILGALNALGEPLWAPPGPNGYADSAAALVSPEGMKARLDISAVIANRIPEPPNPVDLLDKIAGAAASPETRQAVARAETRQQGLALLLMSPEVQRR